ncbi:GtrA family protein [Povalibacter sp.]|uniref:GtrA family protein n=1 Tax=Povalibacter sp. TaxID=1962978 RepID=UPI002F4012FF
MIHGANQLLIFAIIGLINTAVHFLVFLLLMRAFDVPILVASALGYGAGVINSYLMNRLWTFRSAARATAAEFLRFIIVNLVSLATNLTVLKYLTAVVGLAPEPAQLGAIVASLGVNFIGSKWWAFR